MPFVQDPQGVAPKEGHLAIYTDESGEAIAFGRGNRLAIVQDPRDRSGVLPLVLLKASFKKLVFACACGNPRCTKRYTFAASAEGFHPPRK